MNAKTLKPAILSFSILSCVLSACGGGGGNGIVRPETERSPDPVTVVTFELCRPPINADCIAEVPRPRSDEMAEYMYGGRQTRYALIKRGTGYLGLSTGDYQFGGGTSIEAGGLVVFPESTLHSNVVVQPDGWLTLFGSMTGDLYNHGGTLVSDDLIGDVVSDGVLTPDWGVNGDAVSARIGGNLTQTAAGTLVAVIPTDAAFGNLVGGFLSVTGRADIDGTLRLIRGSDWDRGDYPLPGAPLSMQVLHADGGVFGQFAQWTSPGLFVTGAPRYLANDVFFDISAVSAAQAMSTARAGDVVTLQSAAHFDSALANAGTWAMPGAVLSATQRQFLSSVGTIQHLQDYAQATRTFDSLSGHGYTDAANSLLQQAATPAPEVLNRIGNLRAGLASGAWSTPSMMLVSGGSSFSGQRGGFDQWLGDRLLLGSSFGWSDGSLRFDRAGGSARDQSPQWDVYLRRNGSGNTYLFGDVGYSRHQLDFTRQIDLGLKARTAGTRQSFDVLRAWVETGRDYRLGATRLTPFGAVSYAVLHGAGFAESGTTGFELIAQPATYQRLNAVAGLRLRSDWRSHSGRWTSLNVTAGYRQLLKAQDQARAAFAGAPDITFALDGLPPQRHAGWLQLSLANGGERWNWLVNYDRQANQQAVSLGANVSF